MTRPASRRASPASAIGSVIRPLAGFLSSASLLTLLAACAGTPDRPDIPVAQEAAIYRSHARSYYAPPGPPDDPWGPYIEEASKRFDVPDPWIRAVMHQESGGHQFIAGTLTTSPVGAMGLMQLMAPTYDDMRAQYDLGNDAFEPHDNIMAGTAYVRQMYDIYGSPGFLAAYNTGPGRLDDFLTRNRPLPRETRQYVAIIGPQIAGVWPTNRSQTDLMVATHSGGNGVMYAAAAQDSDQTRSVRMAWTKRRDLDQGGDQPVQVAEAPATGATAAPAYTHAWQSLPASGPVQVADATPLANTVQAAWAARAGAAAASASPAAVPVATAAPAQNWTAAPTPTQVAAAPDAAQIDAAPLAVAPTQTASAPSPAAPATEVAAADEQPVADPPALRRERFHLIRPAMAEPAPLLRDAGRSSAARNWSIQVGAFGTPAQASQAADIAQSRSTVLAHTHAEIAGIKQGRGAKIYRARLTGLSRGDALQACERLSHGRSDCLVVSPDARS